MVQSSDRNNDNILLYPAHHANAHDDSHDDEQVGVDTGGRRRDHGAGDTDQQTRAHHMLAAELVREPATRDLRDDVADVEGAEDVPLKDLAPLELAVLQDDDRHVTMTKKRKKTKKMSNTPVLTGKLGVT